MCCSFHSLCKYLRDICSVPSTALGTGDVAVKNEKDKGEKERGRGRRREREKEKKEGRKERKKGEREGGEKEREGEKQSLTSWSSHSGTSLVFMPPIQRGLPSQFSPLAPLITSLRAHSTICTGS